MFNFNLPLKKIKKLLLSINQLIESFFNSFKSYKKFKTGKNRNLENINKKISVVAGIIVISIITYFLFPTFYDKSEIKLLLQKQIYDKYNVKIKFDNQIAYGLFPKPNFSSKDFSIIYDQKTLAKSKDAKIYISINNLFSLKKLKIKDLVLNKSELNINSKNINFFTDIFNKFKSKDKFVIKNSNLFYKDDKEDVIFFLKVKKLVFLKDKKNLSNNLNLNFKIFNVPVKFNLKKNLKDGKISSSLSSKKIRLNIENDFEYVMKNIIGLMDISIMNKKNTFNYKIADNSLNFLSNDNVFKGLVEFKPFYYFLDLNFNQLNTKKIFNNNSLLWSLIDSEIWNNRNLNGNLNINFNKISDSQNLNNFIIKTYLEEGNLIINNSSIKWNNNILIKLNDIQLNNFKNKLELVGEINLDFIDIDKFYSYYQIKKKYRKNLKEIKFDFIYDLGNQKITLDNLKIDDDSDQKINNFLNNHNSKDKNLFNKVTFRNFVKNFFNVYSG